ncbi:hypothetical protein MMC32_005318 [Xylographa parallela]|nr:hypothetical protein [Xylographa parallela]
MSSYTPGAHYSGRNKIPTVDKFLKSLDRDKAERDRKIDEELRGRADGRSDAVPHTPDKPDKAGSVKTVTDPTTGHQVQIADVNKEFMDAVKDPKLSVPNANLGKPTPVKTDPTQSGEEYKHNQDVTAPPDPVAPGSTSDVPIHGEKTNILFHPTPSISYEPMYASLEKQADALCLTLFLATVIVGKMFGGSLWGLIPLGACIASGVFLWMKELVRRGRELEWSSEQQRGETAVANLLPESVEWMNHFLEILWGLINPDMFASVADTLEDVMQASVPGVIESVRVAEINQGNNPLRILSLRALPDSHVKDLKESIHKENKKTKDPQEAAADEEGGDYYNIEVSFAYHAKPTQPGDQSAKARNMHMELVFYLGMKGFFGVPLPVFVELQGLVGTVRLRLQMTPEPPFAKNLTFTLMGVPQVTAGCIPMMKRGPNLLNLPLITNFVNYAISAAASMYVAPKSMSLDLGAMLAGDDVQKDVQALGVMWIRIHRAIGLSKQDKRGSRHGGSDPYINISFSKYGKPMYCTRVITDDLNPIYEETTALLVTPEIIKADEQLSVELWDSDRMSADDIVGKVELSMQKLIQHPGKMYPQVSKLAGMEADSEMPGELRWEVGYFTKPKFRPALRTDGKDQNLPDALKDHEALQDDTGTIDTDEKDAVMHTPPDPLWPSGVCSIVIHQIVSLELENIEGSQGKRKGREYEPAKPYGEQTEEESKKLPSSYCTIIFNDQLVYRTRSKAVSSKPIFNAGTERFIRDWRSAIVTVTVRDSRYRQHDPILGVVPLRLSELFTTKSQVTRWYPLDGGIGFGRIRISLLFRSVELQLPPHMLGWEVGTFEFLSDRIVAAGYTGRAKLKMRTGGSTGAISKTQCRSLDEAHGMCWDIAKKDGKNNVRLPVKFRYRSPVVFEFHTVGKRDAQAYAIVWLHHLVDNEPTDIDIPIWTTKQGDRLCQNYVTEENVRAKEVTGLDDLQEIGRLQFRCQFKAGTDESHEQFVVDNDSRETYESWEACLAEGVRTRQVVPEVPANVQELHEKSLTQGRDVLEQADPEEKKKWLAKDGQDWSGAFGHDPKAYMDSSGRKRAEPGRDKPVKDPIVPADHDRGLGPYRGLGPFQEEDEDDNNDDDESSTDSDDLGVKDGTNTSPTQHMPGHAQADGAADRGTPNGTNESPKQALARDETLNKKSEKRKQRGLMQWKPLRNAAFAKDEMGFAMKRVKTKLTGGLGGREPDVETEI